MHTKIGRHKVVENLFAKKIDFHLLKFHNFQKIVVHL